MLGQDVIGYIEVETFDEGERLTRTAGWADVGNLRVSEPYRRRGVGSWLLGQAADWLRLARVDRLLDYAWLEGTDPGGVSYEDYRAFLPRWGSVSSPGPSAAGPARPAGPCDRAAALLQHRDHVGELARGGDGRGAAGRGHSDGHGPALPGGLVTVICVPESALIVAAAPPKLTVAPAQVSAADRDRRSRPRCSRWTARSR